MGDTIKRAAILSVAARLFAEKGYGNATTAEIAHEAGVAEGTLYHHFDSKDGIFLTIFDEIADGYLEGARRISREGATGADALVAIIRFHFEYVGRNATRFLLILRDFPNRLADPKGAAGPRAMFGAGLTALLSEIVARGQGDGSLCADVPPRDTAETIRGLLYGTTRHKMLGIIDGSLPRLATLAEQFCLRALSPAPRESRKESHSA